MCHLILFLPLLALPAFWLLPPGEATVLYVLVLTVSAGAYWLMMKAMRAPLVNGPATLMHACGVVRHADGRSATVWAGSELWSAESEQGVLSIGDAVEVVGAQGIVLKVRKVAARSA
jgi:membrane protein implicated in regulation of membrane protease activity